jgi:hypothetical protein
MEGRNEFDDCYRFSSADDMISAGLHLTDLNLFDSTSELLITGIHQEQELETITSKVSFIIKNSYLFQFLNI